MFKNDSTNLNGAVIAYFSNGEDAQRAMDDLLANGFAPHQIGAAFRASAAAPSGSATGPEDTGSKTIRSFTESDSTGAGPASDTSAVTAAGLSPGSGGIISGPSRPGPIPGSSHLPHHRHNKPVSSARPATKPIPATGGIHERDTGKSLESKTSMNFGTGEGHLATYPENYEEYEYSGRAFESAFSGMGVPDRAAQALSAGLASGGAIVAVRAGERVADAEKVLEANRGRIRFEAGASSANADKTLSERVRVSGELSRIYPDYLRDRETRPRKAS